MTQKTISLPEKVYNSLKKQKKKKETFSDLISRLLHTFEELTSSPDISTFYGKLEEEEDGEWDQIEDSIYKNRKLSTTKPLETLDE